MLDIEDLHTGYGETRVIFGLTLKAAAGRVLAILGRNGAGKTTTMKAVMGLLPASQGKIRIDGQDIAGRRTFDIARSGIGYVPETRDIFPSLTVRENLELAARLAPRNSAWTLDRVITFFPNLANRLSNGGNELSGGEQQMLAIARALLTNPKLLLLDEPTEGLAPIIVRQIHEKLAELKREGMTMVLVEQNFGFATALADDVHIIGRGRTAWQGTSQEIRTRTDVQRQWLGV
ncbi:ABC transporter ATP-binding protein [Pararhizobium haloflavum]|uniref:ABC transporter ATP-binding protein n=1 Tax=Pararhizobium haloflavum TaxID=2037914 RepID=UPI000C177850|nr:ABC transporter ATP-binding protein [Pararhizobium haloflavum]